MIKTYIKVILTLLAPSLSSDFLVTSGSIAGRAHTRLHKNNQDGLGLYVDDGLIVGVVTDGCSQGRASEVGAQLGATWVAANAPALWRAEPCAARFAAGLAEGMERFLGTTALELSGGARIEPEVVGSMLLFTFLGVVIDRERWAIFGLGDGVYQVNGCTTELDSGPQNAPDYLAYRLLPRQLSPGPGPLVHMEGTTETLYSLLLCTDGGVELQRNRARLLKSGQPQGGLTELEREERLFKNPSLLHKRLVTIGEVNNGLQDDTTALLVKRRPRAEVTR